MTKFLLDTTEQRWAARIKLTPQQKKVLSIALDESSPQYSALERILNEFAPFSNFNSAGFITLYLYLQGFEVEQIFATQHASWTKCYDSLEENIANHQRDVDAAVYYSGFDNVEETKVAFNEIVLPKIHTYVESIS